MPLLQVALQNNVSASTSFVVYYGLLTNSSVTLSIMNVLHYFLDWPTGQVWGNLIVDSLFSIGTVTIGYLKLKKLHIRHHEDMKRHITEQINIDRTSI